MPPDSKALEGKLDRDFLTYLFLTKSLFDNITSEDEKNLCEAWLRQLCGRCITTVKGKRDRNIYLSRLLLQMQDGKLKDIFLTAPPAGDLESPYTVFGLPLDAADIRGFQEMGFQLDGDATGGSGDFSEVSRDGRMYLATRQITNGMMAYLAVTNTEDEPLWIPQPKRKEEKKLLRPPSMGMKSESAEERGRTQPPVAGRFVKRLAQFGCVPLSELRKTPEERERVLEWIDKIIQDCNKWLRGEDPHNEDLEILFELLYRDYKEDPEKAEILEYPKDVRDVLMRDVRQRMTERRAEISRRELILDQYEAEEYVEEKVPAEELDGAWYRCAERPMKDSVRRNLEKCYPREVVERFFELLVKERILIIEMEERDANKKIAEVRNGNLEDIKKELQKIEKVNQEYKEYYCIYKEAEKYKMELQSALKENSSGKGEKRKMRAMTILKEEVEEEFVRYRRVYEAMTRKQKKLLERLEDVREAYNRQRENLKDLEERRKCELENLLLERQKLEEAIVDRQNRLCELNGQTRTRLKGYGCVHE